MNAKLERRQQLADDHFGHDPDAIYWGYVGDLGRVDDGLNILFFVPESGWPIFHISATRSSETPANAAWNRGDRFRFQGAGTPRSAGSQAKKRPGD